MLIPSSAAERSRTAAPPVGWAPLAVSAGLWLAGLVGGVDWRGMSDLGLVSVLPVVCLIALGVLAVGQAVAIARRWTAVAAGGVVALVLAVHATPTLLYGTLRYAWAWKHLGVVDFISRTGTVDPTVDALSAYHGWPGFFALHAMLAEATGVDLAAVARWWPVAVNLLVVALLWRLAAAVSADERLPATACWVYVASSWVGQDYFSPQAMAFVMYLAVVLVLVRLTGRRRASVPGAGPSVDAVRTGVRATLGRVGRVLRRVGRPRVSALGVVPLEVYVMVIAIAASHQLTPLVMAVTCTALVLTGYAATGWLASASIVAGAAWAVTFAWPLLVDNADELAQVGSVQANVDGAVVELAAGSPGQAVVAVAARVLTVAVVGLAAAGVIREWRAGTWPGLAVLLAGSPVLLIGMNGYGGEVLFRVVLFALPGLALLTGMWLVHRRSRLVSGVLVGVVGIALVGGLLLAHLGNERRYSFTPGEVAVSLALYEAAPVGSLLVEGSRSYPGQAVRYDGLTYVPIDREPVEGRQRMLADPDVVLGEWLGEGDHTGAYLLLTRSMAAETEASGSLPVGGLGAIDRALRASEDFTALVRCPDAVVWTLSSLAPRLPPVEVAEC